MTLRTLFEQTWVSLPQRCYMLNINVFPLLVHEKKIFEDLSKCSLFCPLLCPKRGQPLYLNKSQSPSPRHVSCQVWLKLAQWFLRSTLKEKLMPDGWTLHYSHNSNGLWPGEIINQQKNSISNTTFYFPFTFIS